MSYYCPECGAVFEEADGYYDRHYTDYGLCIDQVFIARCPECGCEDIGEGNECAFCECSEAYEDLHGDAGICDHCLKEEVTYENALAYDEWCVKNGELPCSIEIPALAYYLFGQETIVGWIKDKCKELLSQKDLEEYCFDDKDAFANFLCDKIDEQRKNKSQK